MPWQEMHINNKGRQTMKKYIITEYPGLIRQYVVEGKNKEDAYNNFIEDKIIESLEDDYDEDHQPLKIEEYKKQEVA
jgi:hypothetical protein